MSAAKYMMNFAYLGTSFRGSQRQLKGGIPRVNDPNTVQGLLEMGLKYINCSTDTIVVMASRTDAGVHALNSCCHFHFHHHNRYILDGNSISIGLNKYFSKNNVPIRILRTQVAPDTFHARSSAISRTYLYRMIIGKSENPAAELPEFFPIEEYDRALFVCSNEFDVEYMREAAKMFEGLHDFRTFKTISSDKNETETTRRTITSIRVVTRNRLNGGVSEEFSWPTGYDSNSHLFVDVYFEGKGFLYKMVRRIAATLLSAATHRITLTDIKYMLEIPSKHSWIPKLKTLPGFGLYLCNIKY